MRNSIGLHPELGVNPRLTFCPRCGGDGKDIVLAGARNYKTTCPNCSAVNYCSGTGDKCARCDHDMWNGKSEELTEYEKLPSSEPCDTCLAEIDEQTKAVAGGGVYFRCDDCGAQGAIKHSAFTCHVRESQGVFAPEPLGVTFNKDRCPRCGPEPVVPSTPSE